MAIENPWLMPQGIEEVLPQEARELESLRRQLLDLYRSWGYELVMPPFIEFIESLLGDLGKDLDLKTFKLTDQLTGKLMGVRADMTPQVARIDAHLLGRDVATRLCYIGTVLHTRSDEFAASRSPLQVGCELYGHSGVASDVEIIRLMVATLEQAGASDVTIDLGHVNVFRSLAEQCNLSAQQEAALFDQLKRKSLPEIQAWLSEQSLDASQKQMLLALATLNGDVSVLDKARTALVAAGDEVLQAIDYIEQTAALLSQYLPDINIHIDLSELHGYHYKTGLAFAAYLTSTGQELARGGRYDNIGAAFGRARPATGFSTDMKVLNCLNTQADNAGAAILAPAEFDAELVQQIDALRAAGEVVMTALCDQNRPLAELASELGCNRQLIQRDGSWQVENI